MAKNLFRFALIVIVCLIQISFMPNLVSNVPNPNLILLLVLAWTIEIGFLNILPWLIFAGIISDIAFAFPVGVNVILLTLSSYSVSFLSKRFLVANKGIGLFLVAVISIGLAVFYNIAIALYNALVHGSDLFISSQFGYYISTAIQTFLLFLIIFSVVAWFEKYLSYYDKKIDIKIK